MALNVTQRWLTIWLSSIGAFTLFVVVAVVCMFPSLMDAGLVGMVINYSMMASGTLQGFIDSFSQLELQMNSVERVKFRQGWVALWQCSAHLSRYLHTDK